MRSSRPRSASGRAVPPRRSRTGEPGRSGRGGFEPWWLPVAVDGDEIVGVAYLVPYPDIGWVMQIAVRRSHRGRGLGQALLKHACREFHLRGFRLAGVSTDSRTGALGLYEHVGMKVARSYTHYAKEL